MPERVPTSPIDIRCPTCGAPPGERCRSRRELIHQSRQDALKQVAIELRKLTEWNQACQK